MQENPRENNNFESIISTWRRLSGEQTETSAFLSMSGDSPSNQVLKKKEEDSNLLIIDRPKGPIATAASAGAAVLAVDDKPPPPPPEAIDSSNPDEKQEKSEFIRYDKEDSKDGAGDANFADKDKSFLENDSDSSKAPESKSGKERGDKVDSVYLRPPPPNKVRSNTSSDDEDCGIKCLYYTLQCCDCVLM